MTGLIEYIRTNPAAAATIIAASIALCGVAISALVAFTTARRSVYISSVTAERSKWIEKLRANIADLLGVCSAIHLCRISDSPQGVSREHLNRMNEADRLVALITLQLNPADKSGIDMNLIKHMNVLVEVADKGRGSYRAEERKFIRHSQFMLKEEWEKVKTEVRGPLMSLLTFNYCKALERNKDYRRFCQEVLNGRSPNK